MQHNKADINWIARYLEGTVFDGKRLKECWNELIDENRKLKSSLEGANIVHHDLVEKLNKSQEQNREYQQAISLLRDLIYNALPGEYQEELAEIEGIIKKAEEVV